MKFEISENRVMTQENFRKLFPDIGNSFRKILWVTPQNCKTWEKSGKSFRDIPWVLARFLEIVSGICLYGLSRFNGILPFILYRKGWHRNVGTLVGAPKGVILRSSIIIWKSEFFYHEVRIFWHKHSRTSVFFWLQNFSTSVFDLL